MSAQPRTLAAEIHDATGVNAATCYQCGKCSAGLPDGVGVRSAPARRHAPRHAGPPRRRRSADESIWLCLTCETCSARCPNACDPARVIDALREMSLDAGVADLPRTIGAFHKAFLEQIRSQRPPARVRAWSWSTSCAAAT